MKDWVENTLHTLVCAGTMTLATAQDLIATDWWSAYETYVLGDSAAAPAPVIAPQPAPDAPQSAIPSGATARCNDGTFSFAAHHQGACSRHGGVAIFFQ